MKISIIGTGYVGLVASACFAETGNSVVAIDNNIEKIRLLKRNIVPFYEPRLETLVSINQEKQRLEFKDNIKEGIKDSEIVFIAVGTPEKEDGKTDLSFLWSAVDEISKSVSRPIIVVIKSTIPVGTTDKVQDYFDKNSKQKVSVIFNPEFLREGSAVNDFMKPDRVILGGKDENALNILKNLYDPFVRVYSKPILIMDARSAEMVKYASNTMLATRISFMNEIAKFCDKVGADIEKVRIGVGTDTRISPYFLFAGLGFGGSCFPKDLHSLITQFKDIGIEPYILNAVDIVNKEQAKFFIEKMINEYGDDWSGLTISIWGLSHS